MIAVRFASYAALALVFGLPLFALHAVRGAARPAGSAIPFRGAIGAAAAAGLLLSAAWLALLAAAIAGVSLGALDRATIAMILSGTAIGAAWQARVAALAVALLLVAIGGRAPRLATVGIALAGAVALGSLAWTGHGAVDEGMRGWVHLTADIVHLLAAGAWIGALFAFVALAFRRAGDPVLLHRVLHGFAGTGTVVVIVLLVTGAASGWVLVGPAHLLALPDSDYGRLLLVKLALFAAMLGLAAANRYAHAPALLAAPGAASLAALRRSLVAETLAALAVLWLVAWLGLLAPPSSA